MKKNLFWPLLCLLLVAVHCTDEDKENDKTAAPDTIYPDYTINAEEGKEMVTVLLQFRAGGAGGENVALGEGSNVQLDGEPLAPNAAPRTGTYYEIQKPLASFAGEHTISFTSKGGRSYKETFSFTPFSLQTEPDDVVPRQDFTLQLQGLKPLDYIRVILTDTSFATPDINDVDTVHNGQLVLSAERLEKVASGPVTLLLYREEEQQIKSATRRGGQLSITYGLTREFELRDK